jgi:hypothetical protein
MFNSLYDPPHYVYKENIAFNTQNKEGLIRQHSFSYPDLFLFSCIETLEQ